MAVFLVKIDKTQLSFLDFGSDHNLARWRDWCKQNHGKEVRIEPLKRTRTVNQNSLYWFYLDIIERETGNLSTDLHELFKRTLLPPKFITVLKQTIKVPKSTKDLDKTEFSDYMERICALTSVPIPDVEAYKKYIDSAPLNG